LQPEDVDNLLKYHAKYIIASPAQSGEDDYTITGRVVQNGKHRIDQKAGGVGSVELSLSELPVGTYLYRVTTNATVQQGRFTKSE
jgi:hypothetical protein